MKRPARLVAAVLCVLPFVVVADAPQSRELLAGLDGYGGFAFSDQKGAQLLLTSMLAQPNQLTTALCAGNRRASVRFERQQVASGVNDGRQTARNFDTLAGSVFTVADGQPDPDSACFLASPRLLAGSAPLPLSVPPHPGPWAQMRRFASRRPVRHCWSLSRVASGLEIDLVEFEIRGKDALASVVLVDGGRTLFADYTAEFRGAGQDLWRADDGGVLDPDGFDIVCLLKRADRFMLAIAWSGAEGQSLSFWISEGRDRFRQIIQDYWYQAPV